MAEEKKGFFKGLVDKLTKESSSVTRGSGAGGTE